MSNFNQVSAFLGLVALGAMTSCSKHEDVSDCSKQRVCVELNQFKYLSNPLTKADAATGTVSQIAFKAFDADGAEVYAATQTADDTDFGTLNFELAPGAYTFVAVGNKLGSNAPQGAMVSISSVNQATLPEALPTDVFSLTEAVTIEPRTPFTTSMTLPRVMSQFRLVMTDILPANVATFELIANPDVAAADAFASFDPADGSLLTERRWTKSANVSASAGRQSISFSLNMLLGSDQEEADITVNAYDAAGSLVTTLTLQDVPMKRNRVTVATGALFNAGSSQTLSFLADWSDPYEMTF